MARLNILSNDEFDRLYKIPKIEEDELPFIFEIEEDDKNYLDSINDISGKIHYILTLGYFRASQYLFNFTFQSVKRDARYVLETYFPDSNFPQKQISKHRNYSNKQAILKKYGMSSYNSGFESCLRRYLDSLVRQHIVPKYLLDSLLDYCCKHKIIRPSYTTLQNLISNACNGEKKRLSNKLYTLIDKPLRISLAKLLEKDDLFFQLTSIKKDQKNFSTNEIRSTIKKQQSLSDIYKASVPIIKELGISEQNVFYYSDLALYHTVYGLREIKKKNLMRLYLLCYAHHRFLKINDHLASSLIYKVRYYADEADIYQMQEIYSAQADDMGNRNSVANILSIIYNKQIQDHELRPKIYKEKSYDQFHQLIKDIKKPNFSPEYYRWEYYKSNIQAIKTNIRLIFKVLNFQSKNQDMMKAINFLKSYFENNKQFSDYSIEEAPISFIPQASQRYIFDKRKSDKKTNKSIDADCYEFMLYFYLEKSLSNGSVTIAESTGYTSLKDELFSDEEWLDKSSILKDLENKIISTDFDEIFDKLEEDLSLRYEQINENIVSGENKKIKIKHDKSGEVVKWHLPNKKEEEAVNNSFFDKLPTVSISEVINFAQVNTGFMKSFTHILPAYSKNKAEPSSLSACIIAKGTGSDIYKMKDISDVSEKDLESAYNSFIRHKTLVNASNEVMKYTQKLSIFEKYNLADYGVHASVDGQKLETKYNIIKSRFSKKYYGKGKGVSALTMSANHLPLATKIIGSNDHESHSLYDIVSSNTSDIEVTAISGDMHSVNRVNFALLYMFGYQFMPRFTNLDKRAAANLVCFDDPEKYADYMIRPNTKVNKKLIKKEWDNLLRIFATLGLKKITQTNIVKKLSSHKSDDTIKALIEFDKIIMSIYILHYIDNEDTRKVVFKSLNRGESYHQLRSAIAKVSGRKLAGKSEIEIINNNECARLMTICIIFYNASILSGIYDYYKSKNKEEECNKIIRLSPVAWQHINLIGRYEFKNNTPTLDLQGIVKMLINDSKIGLALES